MEWGEVISLIRDICIILFFVAGIAEVIYSRFFEKDKEDNSCADGKGKEVEPFEELRKSEKPDKIFYPFHRLNGSVEVINLKKIICVKGITVEGKSLTYIECGYNPKTGEATDNLLIEEDVETVIEIMQRAEIDFVLPFMRDEAHKIGED